LTLNNRFSQSASVDARSCSNYQAKQLPSFHNASVITKLQYAIQSIFFRSPPGTWHLSQRAVMHKLEQAEPDLIHFHSGNVAVKLAPYAAALRLPYTLSIRGTDIQVQPLIDPQYANMLKNTLVAAQRIHAVCDALGDAVLRICPSLDSVETIRTCVPIPDNSQITVEDNGSLSFVSVGRLHWRKAYNDLLRAMVHIPDARLTIVGDGPEKEHLLFLIKDLGLEGRVTLTGRLSYKQFATLYSSASAYVQTSIAEGFSNALGEAMAHGKLVFATNVGGTGEVINDGVNGFFLPVGDPLGIARRLNFAKDLRVRKELGEAARRTALQQFAAEQHAAKFVKFFEKALEVRRQI
jgi:colanic acid/amylovoran biosynthesis glycosyltransferase